MKRPNPPEQLLGSSKTGVAHLELTSRCNLRCVYCAVSQPTYHGADLDLRWFDDLIETLEQRRVDFVYVNGHGETTMIDGWDDLANRLLGHGFKLGIVTNLSRPLSDPEIDTLSHFEQLCVSCDTADPALFTALRRKAKLSVLLENQERIRQRAAQRSQSKQRISWSCVVSDRNVFGLADLVSLGIDHGVQHFEFCNLTKYPDLPGVLNVSHISTLELNSMKQARQTIQKALRSADRRRCTWSVQSGLLDLLEQRIHEQSEARSAAPKPAVRHGRENNGGRTRLCLDPWSMLYVQADGVVRACCWNLDPMGDLKGGDSLRRIADGAKLRELRRQLLIGELPPACQSCPARPWAPLARQERAVLRLLGEQSGLSGTLLWRQRRNVLLRALISPLRSAMSSMRRAVADWQS